MADVFFASVLTLDVDVVSALGVPLDGIGSAIDSHYTLDEVADPRFDSVGSADMTTGNGTPVSISVPGGGVRAGDRALGFTRTNSEYIITSGSSVHDKADEDFVIAGYFRISNKNAPAMSFFSKSTENGNQRGYLLQWDDIADRYRFLVSSDGSSLTTVVANSFGAPSTGVFNYIVCTHDAGSNTISIQVNDGPIDSTAHAGGAFQNTASFAVAMSGDSATGAPSAFMVGFVSELTVFNRLLTAEERSAIYGGGTKDVLPYLPNFAFSFSADADFTMAGLNQVSFEASVEVDVDGREILTRALDDIVDADFLHYWTMNKKTSDASGGVQDDSAGAAPAFQNGVIGNPAGKIGNAADLNGSTNKFTFPSGSADMTFDGSTDITVCFWANVDAFTGLNAREGVIGKYRFSGNQKGWIVGLLGDSATTGHGEMLISNDGVNVNGVGDSTIVNSGGFHFFIMEYRAGPNELAVQTDNGSIVVSAAFSSIAGGTEPVAIGNDKVTSTERFFDGIIDELFVMTKLLTTAQRDALWSGGNGVNLLTYAYTLFSFSSEADADFAMGLNDTNLEFAFTADGEMTADLSEVLEVIRQDLLTYIPLDEMDNATRRDVVGVNDTVENTPTVEQTVAIHSNGSPAGAHFSGAGAKLSKVSPVGLNLGASSLTIGFWARIDGSLGTTQGAVSVFTPTGDQRKFSVFLDGATDLWKFIANSDGTGAGDFIVADDDVIGALGEVHFVLAWYDGDADTVNIQVDDTPVISVAGPSTLFSSTADLDVGTVDFGAEFVFDGLLQDVAIWGRVLTAAERTALYAAGAGVWLERYIPRNLQTFTDMWKFNELADVALAGVNGTSIPIFSATIGHSLTGHVEDPSGVFNARGDVDPLGAGTGYWAKGFVASDAFDIRGKVSCCWAGWFLVPTGIVGNVNFLTIHGEKLNPGGANGQAFITQLLAAGGGATSPNTFLEDGITPFSGPGVKADSTGVAVPRDTWQFMAGGYDADRNVGFCFWGRAVGEYYYSEVAAGSVFKATGFAYTGVGTEAGIGEYMFPTPQSNAARFDQSVWFAGTPVAKTFIPRLPSIIDLWNQHVGTPFANMNFAGIEFAFAFEAVADFTTTLDVIGEFSFSFSADADFAMLFRHVKFAAQSFVAPDFTAALQVRNLDLSFSFTADADFTNALAGSLDGIGTAIDSHYPLEEASGTRFDATGNQDDLTDINTVGQAAGQIGNAADFDDTASERLEAANSSVHDKGDEDFTVAGWFRIDASPVTAMALWSKTTVAPAGNGQLQLQYLPPATDRLRMIVSTTGNDSIFFVFNSLGAPPKDTMIFLVFWHDSVANTVNVQANNGTIDSTAHSLGVFQGSALFRIGAHGNTEPAATTFLDGRADEVVIFNRVLTAEERSAMYAGGAGVDLQPFYLKEFVF